eukprot:TRINITY_DN5794_c0_g1_i2.p1 TRINITY_DN5794_c0_g1~~TRINITY_DN5794_c0_g1_i2.p1  ORF type:complete len:308 (+),score=50.78 TRINITY_DN5794_c0_g1_i2:102-1025(+)
MGIYLSAPSKDKITAEGASMDKYLKFIACGMQGWRVQMEDSHLAQTNIAPNTHIFGVFDGHGGREVARFVERHFVEELLQTEEFKKKQYEEALRRTFLRMDELMQTSSGKKELTALKREGKNDDDDTTIETFAGCTANVVLVQDNSVYVANSGDTRAVLCRAGKAVELSNDHKPDVETEKQRIERAGGFVHDGRVNGNLSLSRAIGDLEYKKNPNMPLDQQLIIATPEIRTEQINKDDQFLLVGCDGIWEQHNSQEIVDLVQAKLRDMTPKRAVEQLLDELLAPNTQSGIGCDNMTCVLIIFNYNKV